MADWMIIIGWSALVAILFALYTEAARPNIEFQPRNVIPSQHLVLT